MNNKTIMIGLIAIAFVTGSIMTSIVFADPLNPPQSNPNLRSLWNAISSLQTQIDAIVATPGPAGPQGPAGADGQDGAPGQDGTNGVDGSSCTIFGTIVSCTDGTSSDVQGPPGNGGQGPIVTYVSGLNMADGRDSGLVTGRELTFVKQEDASKLRITYSDNFRILGTGAAEWEILIDGKSISRPHALLTAIHESEPTDNNHRSSTIIGFAEGVPSGKHTITVNVSQMIGTPDIFTGWESSFLLQVEELQ